MNMLYNSDSFAVVQFDVPAAGETSVAGEIRRRFSVPLGINVLRNDAGAAMAVAAASGANFIRVNILIGARVADQGIIQGQAHQLLRIGVRGEPTTCRFGPTSRSNIRVRSRRAPCTMRSSTRCNVDTPMR